MLRKMIMPTLGLDMESALIQQWLKAEGDTVAKDEPVVLVETDKATTEIVAPTDGVLKQILRRDGTTVPVTDTIAYIETAEAGDREPEPAPPLNEGTGASPHPGGPDSSTGKLAPSTPESEHSGLRASPAARHEARELGVDLSMVEGTGPGGRIQGNDVRGFSERMAPAPSATPTATPTHAESLAPMPMAQPLPTASVEGRLVPMSRKRRITAERMSLSARTVARLTMDMGVDATEMIRLRQRLQPAYEARGARLTHNDLLIKVVAVALVDHPYLNARWSDEGIVLLQQINIGIAVAVQDGLVVPVIHDAHRKRLDEVSAEASRLVARAREEKLSMEEITGGTFTITNLGMYGVESFTPIVNPPEAAILGVGAMADRPVGCDGEIVLRPTMTLSLSFDHRIVDGAPAAQFLQRVKKLLEEPYLLL